MQYKQFHSLGDKNSRRMRGRRRKKLCWPGKRRSILVEGHHLPPPPSAPCQLIIREACNPTTIICDSQQRCLMIFRCHIAFVDESTSLTIKFRLSSSSMIPTHLLGSTRCLDKRWGNDLPVCCSELVIFFRAIYYHHHHKTCPTWSAASSHSRSNEEK